jgi:hypothetical protein
MNEPSMTEQATLERQISTVLTEDNSNSSVIATLIAETETAIVTADQDAKLEQERVFDPLAAPDPKAVREAMQAAEFVQTWLRSALLRLQQRLRETQEREVYTEFEARVVDLLTRTAANDAEISNLHSARSSGVKLHLLEAELVARGLERFTRDVPSIAKELKLPAFEPGQPPAWPPRPQFHRPLAAPMPYDPRFSNRWWEAGEARRRHEEERQAQEAKAAEAARKAFYGQPAS